MSTSTRNCDPALDSLSADEDQQKAIDQLFLQVGQKGSLEQPMQRPTSVAMRAIDPLGQSPVCHWPPASAGV